MGHVDRCRLQLMVKVLEFRPHRHAQYCVEIGKGLVHEEQVRRAHNGAGKRHALPLASRQGFRPAVERLAEPHLGGGRLDLACPLRFRHSAQPQGVADILANREMRIEAVVLEHHRDVAVARRPVVNPLAADQDVPGGDRLQSRHHAHRRRLAASRWAQEHKKLPVARRQAEVAHGDKATPRFSRDLASPRPSPFLPSCCLTQHVQTYYD